MMNKAWHSNGIVSRFVVGCVLSLIVSGAAAAEAPTYAWKAESDTLSLRAGEQTVFTLHFAADGGHPYVHPLALPGGPVMSDLAPADHRWHRGLWLSWKFLNGVNYWEYPNKQATQPDGKTAVVGKPEIRITDEAATVVLHLESSKEQVVMTEERTIAAHRPRADGSYTLDWTSKFTAGKQDVVLDRTPPKEFSWGGYGGLGFRAAATMRDFQASNSAGQVGKAQAHAQPAKWLDYSGVFGNKDEPATAAGMAIFDHPANRRHPTRWYVSDTKRLPYFGTAPLYEEPLTLKAGESLTLKYRVFVHPGLGDKAVLDKEYAEFAKP